MKLGRIVLVVALAACSKGNESSSGQSANPEGEAPEEPVDEKPEPEPKSWFPIEEAGIQVEVPGKPTLEPVIRDLWTVNAPACDFQIGKPITGESKFEETVAITKNVLGDDINPVFSKKQNNSDGTYFIEGQFTTKYGKRWRIVNRIKVEGAKYPIIECGNDAMHSEAHFDCVAHACATAKKLN